MASHEAVVSRVTRDQENHPTRVRPRGAWVHWSDEEKDGLLHKFVAVGRSYRRLKMVTPRCPPRSTLLGWRWQRLHRPAYRPMGRPGLLTGAEELELLNVLKLARQVCGPSLYLLRTRPSPPRRGAVLDSETVGTFAHEVSRLGRPSSSAAPRSSFTADWVTHFKKRHGLSNLRGSSSDKPPSSYQDIIGDNDWRQAYLSFVENPAVLGVDSPAIPASLQFAADETPLQYVPRTRGTF